jgi:flagellar basal-body rod modification protein FlgD
MMSSAGANSSTTSTASSSTAKTNNSTLNQADFLKLLVAKLTTQDPMNPQTDTDFIGQLAQFSSLDQSSQSTSAIAQLRANSFLGRNVELKSSTGAVVTGMVSAIKMDGTTPKLMVNGNSYDLSQVMSVTASSSSISRS